MEVKDKGGRPHIIGSEGEAKEEVFPLVLYYKNFSDIIYVIFWHTL